MFRFIVIHVCVCMWCVCIHMVYTYVCVLLLTALTLLLIALTKHPLYVLQYTTWLTVWLHMLISYFSLP